MMGIPRIRFDGCDNARQMNRIFAENLYDLVSKVEKEKGDYEAGFFHTSSMPHEGTHYYGDMWSRDVGRGLIEISRFGFAKEAELVARFLLEHMNQGDHWGRTVNHDSDEKKYETDGNALVLLGIYHAWKISGMKKEMGKEFLECTMPVFKWIRRMMDECPYGDLVPCESELSGNPDTPYQVYGIFGNYAVKVAIEAFKSMAVFSGCQKEAEYLEKVLCRLSASLLDCLIARKNISLAQEGCWINGLDGRDGRPYEFSEWVGTAWPIYHWTRQLPFILDCDRNLLSLPHDKFLPVHMKSYDYIHAYMSSNKYFYRYGFVSNTGWTGTGGRHDDTMCGYGQGFMTQAALLTDDINTYTKLLEGITRLAYDGNIVNPLAYDFNPWVMHECFNYPNYEEGIDHTFGELTHGRPGIMDNPGDEGNLVQAAEIVKALAIVAGVENINSDGLRIMPRLPWTWDEMLLKDFPVMDNEGNMGTLEFKLKHERWLRTSSFYIKSRIPLRNAEVRIGPFPRNAVFQESENMAVEIGKGGKWLWVKGLSGDNIEGEVKLKD